MATVPATLNPRPASRVSLKSGGAVVLTLRLVTVGAALLMQLTLVRVIGDSGFGVYAFAMAWVQALAVFGRAGLENTSLRQIAESRSQDEPAVMAGFMAWSRRTSLITSLMAAVVLIVATVTFIAPNDPITRPTLLLGAVSLPILTLRQFREAQLRAVHHVWQSMLGPAVWPTLLILFLVGAQFLDQRMTPADVMGLQLVVLVVCFLLVWKLTRRSPLAGISTDRIEQRQTHWRRTAMTFLAFDAVILLRGRTSVIIAGMMIDTDTAGVFAAAERIAEVVALGVVSINTFAAPHFAALHAAGRREELRDLIRGSQQLGLLFAVPVAIGFIVFGQSLLGLYDISFQAGYPWLVIMTISTAIGALAGPAAYVLAMSGKERITLYGSIVCMVCNLVLSFGLTPFFGATGLAVTHLVTMAVWTVYMLWHLRQHMSKI